ncbi:hypothetical protein Tco_0995857 [Tanacetum coccineum]
MLETRLKMLETIIEMKRHPEDHACQSAAMLHELLNDVENLRMESSTPYIQILLWDLLDLDQQSAQIARSKIKDKDVRVKTKDVGDKTRNGKASRGPRMSASCNVS